MWKKLKRFLLLSVLLLPWSCVPLISYSYADVVLTDEEATELMSTIQESKKDLQELQSELTSDEEQLNAVKSDYDELKKSYEQRLKEEKKKSTEAKIFAYSASASTLLISIVLFIVIL